jgi:phospholipid/cholesterol/gamma-HCH transport system substrate-binding protein
MSETFKRRLQASDMEMAEATPRGTGGKEAQVGLFVLVGMLTFLVVLFMMTDPATFRGRYMLVTEVSNAGGVRSGDPIRMQGVNIGRVHTFEMLGDTRVFITMEIEGEWQIPMGSTTLMGEAGLFGGRVLDIERGPGPGYYADFDTIPGVGASGSGLLGSVDVLSTRAESVLASLDAMLSDETVGSIQGTARELESLLSELAAVTREQRGSLADLTATLTEAAQGVASASEAGPEIARAVARADSAMAMLNRTTESLDGAVASLGEILGRMERGEGTLGRLSTDETLYVNLNDAATSLSALLQDLQANPKKYINLSIF